MMQSPISNFLIDRPATPDDIILLWHKLMATIHRRWTDLRRITVETSKKASPLLADDGNVGEAAKNIN